MEKRYRYTVVFEPAQEGGYVAHVPALPGLWTQGETIEEARSMAREAIIGYLEALAADGQPVPEELSRRQPVQGALPPG
jgi:predicted RNase H-like HicB family nuclease